MPAKISMRLNNDNYTRTQFAAYQANLAAAPKPKVGAAAALNTSIVGRIHNVRPGCGSCGK
jgi:hypothetical protein